FVRGNLNNFAGNRKTHGSSGAGKRGEGQRNQPSPANTTQLVTDITAQELQERTQRTPEHADEH
ncbi:MAG TPA: hypothetical protein VJU82_04405, partial [Acidobacteriaceae bacterium]|nr:hypothetical protein [Acidobacteriaceae bacterium]